MRVWIAGLLLASAAGAGTRIQDTLYTANGQLAAGRLVIAWPAMFVGGRTIAAGSLTYAVANGAVNLNLEPNEGAVPAGTSYSVRYVMSEGSSRSETWVVPASSVPVGIGAVRVNVAPTPTPTFSLTQITGLQPGDLLRGSGGAASRLPKGSDGQCLAIVAGEPKWSSACGAMASVFGRTGAVAAQSGDYAAFYGKLSGGNAWTGAQSVSGPLAMRANALQFQNASGSQTRAALTADSDSGPLRIEAGGGIELATALVGLKLNAAGRLLAGGASDDGASALQVGGAVRADQFVGALSGVASGNETPLTFSGVLQRTGSTVSCPSCLSGSATYADPPWLSALSLGKLGGAAAGALVAGQPGGGWGTLAAGVDGHCLRLSGGQPAWATCGPPDGVYPRLAGGNSWSGDQVVDGVIRSTGVSGTHPEISPYAPSMVVRDAMEIVARTAPSGDYYSAELGLAHRTAAGVERRMGGFGASSGVTAQGELDFDSNGVFAYFASAPGVYEYPLSLWKNGGALSTGTGGLDVYAGSVNVHASTLWLQSEGTPARFQFQQGSGVRFELFAGDMNSFWRAGGPDTVAGGLTVRHSGQAGAGGNGTPGATFEVYNIAAGGDTTLGLIDGAAGPARMLFATAPLAWDTGLSRISSGVLEINNGAVGQRRDLTARTVNAITFVGDLTGTASGNQPLDSELTAIAALGACAAGQTYVFGAGGALSCGSAGAVSSVFGRAGAVSAQAGDYNTSQVAESGNLYFTDARARSAISVAGPLSYDAGAGTMSVSTVVGGATPTVESCKRYTVPHTQLTANALTQTVDLETLPANVALRSLRVTNVTQTACGGCSPAMAALSLTVGDGTAADSYIGPFSLLQASGTFFDDGGSFSGLLTSHPLRVTFTAAGKNLGNGSATNLTAGSVDITACMVVLP